LKLFIDLCFHFIEDCCLAERQIQRDGTCRSTMPARELSANGSEKNNGQLTLQIWTPCRYHSGE